MREDAPELVDLVAAGAAAEKDNGAVEVVNGKGAKRKRVYEDHRPMSDITAGIKRGIYHQARVFPARSCALTCHQQHHDWYSWELCMLSLWYDAASYLDWLDKLTAMQFVKLRSIRYVVLP